MLWNSCILLCAPCVSLRRGSGSNQCEGGNGDNFHVGVETVRNCAGTTLKNRALCVFVDYSSALIAIVLFVYTIVSVCTRNSKLERVVEVVVSGREDDE